MGKLPWAKFFYADFIQDTSILSNQATGGWIRILCHMWHKDKGTIIFTIKQLSRLLGTGEDEAMEILKEIMENKIANANITEANKKITITSRRIKREVEDRENNRIRQKRFQNKKKDNTPITGKKSEDKKSEDKKSEDNTHISPSQIQQFFDLWNQYAVNGIKKANKLTTSRSDKIKARLKEEPDINYWMGIFSKLQKLPFYCGGGNQGWYVNIDHVISNDTNHVKISEERIPTKKETPLRKHLREMEENDS